MEVKSEEEENALESIEGAGGRAVTGAVMGRTCILFEGFGLASKGVASRDFVSLLPETLLLSIE